MNRVNWCIAGRWSRSVTGTIRRKRRGDSGRCRARRQERRSLEREVWSGDTVRRDEEGYLYFIGRQDDMIKTSGFRVSPTEVEEEAYASGLVRDAVALGAPHERLGQGVVLVVTPAQDGDCGQRSVARRPEAAPAAIHAAAADRVA